MPYAPPSLRDATLPVADITLTLPPGVSSYLLHAATTWSLTIVGTIYFVVFIGNQALLFTIYILSWVFTIHLAHYHSLCS